MALPTDAKARKNLPLANGVLFYFPDALAAVAEVSFKGNEKHNPGQPLHWSREKSSDHADCVVRHVIDAGPDWTAMDLDDDTLHAVKVAWRALAMAQIAIERSRAKTAVALPKDWHSWLGGACPVADDALVQVILRGTKTSAERPAPARNYRWWHDGWLRDGDIVQWRLA